MAEFCMPSKNRGFPAKLARIQLGFFDLGANHLTFEGAGGEGGGRFEILPPPPPLKNQMVHPLEQELYETRIRDCENCS